MLRRCAILSALMLFSLGASASLEFDHTSPYSTANIATVDSGGTVRQSGFTISNLQEYADKIKQLEDKNDNFKSQIDDQKRSISALESRIRDLENKVK